MDDGILTGIDGDVVHATTVAIENQIARKHLCLRNMARSSCALLGGGSRKRNAELTEDGEHETRAVHRPTVQIRTSTIAELACTDILPREVYDILTAGDLLQ